MGKAEFTVAVGYRGKDFQLEFSNPNPVVNEIGYEIEKKIGLAYETVKLIGQGLKGALNVKQKEKHTATQVGLVNGRRYMVIGSSQSDMQSVKNARDLPGLLGFEGELKRAANRRRTARNTDPKPPTGPYTFGQYKVLEGDFNPPPAQALKLLYQLASDPGILSIMQKRKWRVGTLSEMPPKGKVGVSAVCVLGYNVNNGQEISLRLRTDDMRGFRKFRKVRETLVHELTHNVWSEHDNNFKMLNSELLRECEMVNREKEGGFLLGGGDGTFGHGSSDLDFDVDVDALINAEGVKLGGVGLTGIGDPREAARLAALGRFAHNAAEKMEVDDHSGVGSDVDAFHHYDAETEAAELEMERLGSMGPESVPESVPEFVPKTSQNPNKDKQPGASQESPTSQEEIYTMGESVPQSVPQSVMDEYMVTEFGMREENEPSMSSQQEIDPSKKSVPATVPEYVPESSMSDTAPSSMSDSRYLKKFISELDPAIERFNRALAQLENLLSEGNSGPDALIALQTIEKMIRNVVEHPHEDKYRSIRLHNGAFQKRVGRFNSAVGLLNVVGFAEVGNVSDPVLQLVGNDPGLLWLGLSVVRSGIERMQG